MKYILSLDQGTTSSRAILIDADGNICAKAQKEFSQIFPKPGWVEHDPNEIWSSQIGVVSEVLAMTGISLQEIAGVGITNQRETTILWHKKTSQPIYNAIVWQDRRTTDICQSLKAKGLEPLFKQKTGLILDPYFSGTKICWLLDYIPGARQLAEQGDLAFGTVDSWLVWKLTKGKLHITDASNASRTLLLNLQTSDWDEEILGILNIPKQILPKVCDSSEVVGMTSTQILSHPLPICGIAGDQQAALFGQACFEAGMAKNTYGTGCFMLLNTGDAPVYSSNNLLTTIAYRIGGKNTYALEGSVFIAGAVVQWLRDNLKVISSSAEVESLACSVETSEGVYFVPAFTGLGAPYWDPYAKGVILGLTRGSTRAHIARAAVESIAYQVTDVLKAMESDSHLEIKELRVDGGAVVNDLLMQFQSDLLHTPVIRPQVTELTAKGAAYLAGLAIGFWKNKEEISSSWSVGKIFTPSEGVSKAKDQYLHWRKAVEVCQRWQGEDV